MIGAFNEGYIWMFTFNETLHTFVLLNEYVLSMLVEIIWDIIRYTRCILGLLRDSVILNLI